MSCPISSNKGKKWGKLVVWCIRAICFVWSHNTAPGVREKKWKEELLWYL